ncbi:MAG: hypothetical protein HXY21_09900 [Parvularculaceae bacterium]|nr:hypothetical protein [Parvularculaceae bacterium]
MIAAFSSSVRRRLGALTRLASTIWPCVGRSPEAEIARSKDANRSSMTPARLSASQNVQIVFRSGALSPSESPRNRESRIYNGVHWAFDNSASRKIGVDVARYCLKDATVFRKR